MLQQTSSAQADKVAFLVRPIEGLCSDVASEASSDATEDTELPQCKIKRNYTCDKCTYYTQNPRAFLVHTRDVHFDKIKIYDCPHCVYASRHQQKLVRHVNLVHNNQGETVSNTNTKMDEDLSYSVPDSAESVERMEDLLEKIEECDDIEIDIEECNDESAINNSKNEKFVKDEPDSVDFPNDNKNYFSCSKCNYVTHVRARYTKHIKYHFMPMIKCTICYFRTPYKWNLDRHMKNHGGTGSFKCTVCNFTADIRLSLTMHEMNHHHSTSAGQSGTVRRRNRVGASDVTQAEEMESLIVKEEEGSGDSRSSHSEMGNQFADIEMISCHSDSDGGTSQLNTKKDDSDASQDARDQPSPTPSSTSDEMKKQCKKPPRPIPQLIPLNASTPNTQTKCSSGEPPAKKFKGMSNSELEVIPINSPLHSKETTVRKKNNSFFDKLKERLLTETGEEGSLNCKNCGFLSKCLSEHSVHEKTCTVSGNKVMTNSLLSSLSSTRCQNCRHRCKSSADLLNHMKTCTKSDKNQDDPVNSSSQNCVDSSVVIQDKDVEPHPMENVVFVWNNLSQNNFEPPLDIRINDDSTLPENNKNFDSESVDEHENMNLSPSQAKGKKIFKCPHCRFGASTASRFHVHIVGHLNKKPFECSLCKYKSNWQWDITKHIKLKSVRDPEHNNAKVLMTDETGRRNYSKYHKFLATAVLNENGMPVFNEKGQYEYQYIDQNTTEDTGIEIDESFNDEDEASNNVTDIQPLNLQTQSNEKRDDIDNKTDESKKLKKTLWKCKKCNYKDPSKEALLEHVREHSTSNLDDSKAKKSDSTPDPSDLAYRCGHCNQLSNWKHVIQRHCRLKHDGIIKVITTVKPKPDEMAATEDICHKCPFKATDKQMLLNHLRQHQPAIDSVFKCYFCPFFVKSEIELVDHLLVHGVTDPEEYVSKAMGCKRPLQEVKMKPSARLPGVSSPLNKRHKCIECPYETNSKSQFMYHEQFHRHTLNTPYKCPECNYSVSKRHLLHQHLRVHGIISKKNEMEPDFESLDKIEALQDQNSADELGEIPYVWVSAKNEFHKMYKCRLCSYVNSQKCRIPYHENIHCLQFDNSDLIVYKCMECKFTCDNAGRLAGHAKTHGEIYGRIYCPVEMDVPDDVQISKLRKIIEKEKKENEDDPRIEGFLKDNEEIKILFFCQKCPARFFSDFDLSIHDKSHDLLFPNKCKCCEYSVPQESELLAHMVVHSDEYQTKTKMLKFVHKSHPEHREPKIEWIFSSSALEMTWVVTNPNKNYGLKEANKKSADGKHVPKQYYCKECPAKFFKTSALNYHAGLHGGEGEHKCKKCSYAVKNLGNLAKHELLHETENKSSSRDYDSGDDVDFKHIPLSGTDLFQRKTEAQKKSFTDKDKLVKPNDHFPPVLQADPQFGYLMHGNPEFIYPTYLKNGRQKEKRYKCHKCPSAFEKREQYKTHLMLHGSKQRYKCELCDYSVKYYANYVQHMRKHQMNDEAQAERKKGSNGLTESDNMENKQDKSCPDIKFAIKTMPKSTLRVKSDFQQFSVCDQQTLRLLQRRRSFNNNGDLNLSDPSPVKERKLHMCLLCPYTNQRQDALNNHYRRHDETDVLNKASHKCSFCDLAVIQSHFLRDHLKTHFHYNKNATAECFSANEDVSFTFTKVDEEAETTELKVNMANKIKTNSSDKIIEKIFVRISTGELVESQ